MRLPDAKARRPKASSRHHGPLSAGGICASYFGESDGAAYGATQAQRENNNCCWHEIIRRGIQNAENESDSARNMPKNARSSLASMAWHERRKSKISIALGMRVMRSAREKEMASYGESKLSRHH